MTGVPLVKEPKLSATVQARGRFSKIRYYNQGSGGGGALAGTATLGQLEHPGAGLSTTQVAAANRLSVEWGTGNACDGSCFDVKARSLKPLWLPESGATSDPFGRDRYLWQYQGASNLGLDGWAQRAAKLGLNAYRRDTDGGGIVTNCSVDQGTRYRRAEHPELFAPDHDPKLFEQEDWGWVAYLSSLSERARTDMASVRRWEIAGWKNDSSLKAADGNTAFTSSTAMFHGWEGAEGPSDCEPLMVSLAAQVQVYSNYFNYTFR